MHSLSMVLSRAESYAEVGYGLEPTRMLCVNEQVRGHRDLPVQDLNPQSKWSLPPSTAVL